MMVIVSPMPMYEAYKNSGVAWIGELPNHWAVKPLKYLLKISNGIDHKSVAAEEGYPVYGSGGVFAYASDYIYEGKAILLGRKGTIDKPLYVDGKFWTVDTMFYATCRNQLQISDKFVYYCTVVIPFSFYSTSTAIPSMTQRDLNNNPVALPPIKEQISIASFLDEKTAQIDDAISIKEKQIALLKERKQIIIQKAVTQGLNPDASMKDSGVDWIGQIPKHWDVLANRALFSERVEAGRDDLPLLSVSIHSGVSSEEISEEENVRGRVKIEDKTKYILVKPGDIAFNMMRAWQGGIGAVSNEGMVSPAYIVAKPKPKINAEYFENQYRCPEFIQQMDRFSKGITDFRKRLYWDSFKQLMTVVPPIDEQLEIVEYIKQETMRVASSIELLNCQIEKLKEYKTALINSAVTGKIKVAPALAGMPKAVESK